MSKPLPSQTTFAGLAPPWSLTSLDANFTNVWNAINDIGTYSNTLSDGGAVNAMVANPPAGVTFSLATGISLAVVAANTTTSTAPTLNVNGTGAKTITDNLGNALSIGAIQAGGRYLFIYDGTNWRGLNVGFGQRSAYKPANTSRTTSTISIDPDLQLTLGIGFYRAEYNLNFTAAVAGLTPGYQIQPAFSGSLVSGAGVLLFNNSSGNDVLSTDFGIASGSPPSGAPGQLRFPDNMNCWICVHFQATSSGVLSLFWGQANTSGNATTLGATSYVTAIQLG